MKKTKEHEIKTGTKKKREANSTEQGKIQFKTIGNAKFSRSFKTTNF